MNHSPTNESLPNVVVLATGGTIAGTGASAADRVYQPGEVPVNALLDAVPEVNRIANLTGFQIASTRARQTAIR
jgi:L-asparaginase